MKKKKPKRPKTGGRQKLPEGKGRVTLTTRVAPDTKAAIIANAGKAKLSLGKYLDSVHGPKL